MIKLTTSTPKILIVDDQPHNLQILYHYLHQEGYEVLVAEDGASALERIECGEPDLILLDVMLPGYDGFEICRQMRAGRQYPDVPVIFMTALGNMADKLEGFQAGGVDYITKPFHHEEVLARVKTHLDLYRLKRELQQKNRELDAFAHKVAHDLRNPLSTIAGYTEMLYSACGTIHSQEVKEYFDNIRFITAKAAEIIEALLLLAGVSTPRQPNFEAFTMDYIMPGVLQRLRLMLDEHQAHLQIPDTWPVACGHPPWIEEIWINYISNALKYGGKPPRIELGAEARDGFVQFWVRDNGAGLSPQQQAKLFAPFTRLHDDDIDGHGLGLFIVRSIVTRLGGSAGVESAPGQGSIFHFSLPVTAPQDDEDEAPAQA